MDWRLVFFTSYEVIMSLIFGLITVFISLKVLNTAMLKLYDEQELIEGNIAVGIFSGTLIISVLIMVQCSILPSVDTLRTLVQSANRISFSIVLLSMAYFIIFFLISLIFSILFIFISVAIYMWGTRHIDEVQELKKNNIAVSIMLSLVLIGLTLYIRPSVHNFISSLVSYETFMNIEKVDDDILDSDDADIPKKRIIPHTR